MGVTLEADDAGYLILLDNVPIGTINTTQKNRLGTIEVAEEYRGKGYGTEALRQLEEALRQQGFETIETSNVVSPAMREILRKRGYEQFDEEGNRWKKSL